MKPVGTRRIKVAVYSIALNEAKHAKRWAETTRHADYRIVADTGSTDATVRLLTKHGVTVHTISVRPWRFDVARNAALALVPEDADVCLTLDLDELVEDNFFDCVRAMWKLGSTTVGLVPFDTGSVWNARRLHARHGFMWRYPIHEIFGTSMGTPDVQQLIVGTKMRHDPDRSKSRGKTMSAAHSVSHRSFEQVNT